MRFVLALTLALTVTLALAGDFTMPGSRTANPANLLWQFSVGPRNAKTVIDARSATLTGIVGGTLQPNLTLPQSGTVFAGLDFQPTLSFTGGSAQMRYLRLGGTFTRNYGPGTLNFLSGIYADYTSQATQSGSCTTSSPPCNLPWLPDFLFDNSIRSLNGGSVNDNTLGPNNAGQLDLWENLTPTIQANAASASLTLGGGIGAQYWKPNLKALGNSSVLTVDRVTQLWDNGITVSTTGSPLGVVTVNKASTVYTADRTASGGTVTRNASLDCDMTSGTGKWCLYLAGTAHNTMTGCLRVGDQTDCTDQLEVTGGDLSVMTGKLNLHKTAATLSSTTNFINYGGGDTISGAGQILNVLNASGTVSATAGPAITGLSLPLTVSRTTGGVGLVTWTAINDSPTFTNTMSTNITTGTEVGLQHNISYSTSGSGTIAGVSDTALNVGIVSGTGVTIANYKGLNFTDGTGAGAVTNQVAVDCGTMAKGGTLNACVRSAVAAGTGAWSFEDTGGANASFKGNIRQGDNTAPTNPLEVATGKLIVNSSGVVSTYNNVATASQGMPSIVKAIDLTTQAAAGSGVALWTPSAAGLYRISVALTLTRAATTSSTLGGAGGVVIHYTTGDGATAKAQNVPFILPGATTATVQNSATNTVGDTLIGAIVVYSSTTAVTYDVGYTNSGATTMQYALRIRVEAL